jgi:hypothetical protein
VGRPGGRGAHEPAGGSPKSLIAAVVAAVDKGKAPPPQLKLAWLCEQWEAPPETGGMLDQDHGLITQMTVASNIYATLKAYRSMKGTEIHGLSDGQRRILRLLRDEKMI